MGRAIERFEAHYGQTVATTATLFPGVMEGLERLPERGLKLAVVTNKPRFFTEQLLERSGIARFFTAVAAGDDGIRKKPARRHARGRVPRHGHATRTRP